MVETQKTPDEFDAQLRADDRIEVVEADLDPSDPRMGSAQFLVRPVAMSADAVLDLLPEAGKGVVREDPHMSMDGGPTVHGDTNVVLSLPP